MGLPHDFKHRLRVDLAVALIAAGKQIDVERPRRELPDVADRGGNLIGLRIAAAPRAQAAGIRHRSGQLRRTTASGHGREQDRMLDTEATQECVSGHCHCSSPTVLQDKMLPCRHNGKLPRCAIFIGECRLRRARMKLVRMAQ
jgi:hypothetical protein